MKKEFWFSLLGALVSVGLLTLILAGCGGEKTENEKESVIPTEKIEGSTIYVEKVENIPEDFIFGMDASSVPAQEAMDR